IERERAIGYLGLRGGLFYHPNGKDVVYAAGGTIVISDLNEPHMQGILRGHDGMINCIALSKSGRYVASGQGGENSDAIIWSFDKQSLLYRMSEHDHGVTAVAFSDDDRLLCTIGSLEDRKILIWDVSNGCIVTIAQHDPVPTTAVAWGGMVRDVKRRDTRDHLLATAGDKKIVLWCLNPYTGDISRERIVCEARGTLVRDITVLTFSEDKESLCCATSTGDFITVDMRTKSVGRAVPAARLGVLSLLCHPQGTVTGGGDGTVTLFDLRSRDFAQTTLQGGVVAMSFSPDRSEIVAGTNQGRMYRILMETLSSLVVSESHCGSVTCVSYALGVSDRFATASEDGTLRIWDVSDYRVLTTAVVRDAGKPLCMVLTQQDLLLSGWLDGQIRTHDTDSGQALWSISNAHAGGVTSLAISHNQRYIMTGGREGELRVWEMRSRDLVSSL
ncbi:unnamed protein product, partial [Choristocarpus tenellus]